LSSHAKETAGSNHVLHDLVYDDETEREAATGRKGIPFTDDDIERAARQLDDNSLWALTGINPTAWSSLTGGGVGVVEVIKEFSPGLESTSGAVPLTKCSVVIPAVEATFIITGTAMVSFSNVNGHSNVRLFNSTDIDVLGREWEIEMEDTNSIVSPVLRQEFKQTIAAGAKTIEFQYFVGQGSGTIAISDAYLTATEVISV